jgi:FkbM family methyltransferase
MFLSHAQNFEDVYIRRLFPDVVNGTYVDVGAFSPSVDSITKSFYDAGWRGINIEPIEALWEVFLEERPDDINLNVAISASSDLVSMFRVDLSGLSTVIEGNATLAKKKHGFEVEEVSVKSESLDSVWRRHLGQRRAEFLKIDVEGAELEVLKGAADTLQHQRAMVLIIEAIEPITCIPNFQQWEHLVIDTGYQFVMFDGVNNWYLSRELFEMKGSTLKVPVNYLDDFVPASAHLKNLALESQLNELQLNRADELTSTAAALDAASHKITEIQLHTSEVLKRKELAEGELVQRKDLAEQELQRMKEQLDSILSSRTWRALGPLRRLVDRVRNL